jgi:hypothetical protein
MTSVSPGGFGMNRYVYGRRFIEERHRYRRWIDPRIGSLRRADVLAYLKERRWVEVTPDRPNSLVFREPEAHESEEPFYPFVPDSEEYADYKQGMFELLTGLAEYEDRQASAVIDDIRALATRRQQANGSPTTTTDVKSTR